MPISPLYTWTQDEHHIDLVITIKHQKLNQDTVQFKVSPHVFQLWAPQHLLIIDLYDTITWDYRIEYHQSRACVDVRLNKATAGIWPQLQHTAPHSQLLTRRTSSLQQWESHQQQIASQRSIQRTSHAQHVREQGWAVGSRERDALTSIKAQERVVATEDLRTWSEHVKEKIIDDDDEEEDNKINPASMVIQAITSPSAAASVAASSSTSTPITPHPAVEEITRTLPPPRRHNTIKVSFTAQSSSAPARADDDNVDEIKLDKKPPTTIPDDARHINEQSPLHLKEKGDTLFHQQEWHGAYHAYTDVINKLHDIKDTTLLCRTLANRAAVSMKLAIPMGTYVIQPCINPLILPSTSTSSHIIISTTLATWSQQYIHWQDIIHDVEECEQKMNGMSLNEQEKIDFSIKLHLRAATAASSLCDHKTVIRHTSRLLDLLSKISTSSITSHDDIKILNDRHMTYQQLYDQSKYLQYHHDGEIATSHGTYDKAIQAYTHALAINPHRLITWINRANVYATMGYIHECIADVCYALSLIERVEKGQINVTSTSTSTPDWCIQQSQQIAHTPTRDLIRSRLYARRGACLYTCGNLHLSYRDYDMAYQYDSNTSLAADRTRLYYEWQRDIMLQRARSAYHTSKWLQGVKLYTDVITHHTTTCPDIPDRSYLATLLIDRAACYLQASEYDECIADVTRALDIDPTSIHRRIALIRRGTAYIWQGKNDVGCDDYIEALRLNNTAQEQEKWKEEEIQQVQHDLQMIRGQSN